MIGSQAWGSGKLFFQFKRPKLEKGCSVITRSASWSLQGSRYTICKSFLYSEHDFELLNA
jgi:hypothetical protein